MGTAFEDLCAAFLTHDPIQSLELRDVKTFADWARERDLDQTDTGIDLVAELRNEPGFAAIQCKFLQTDKAIPKPEIASFLAASGRPEFRRRILIDTTGRPWSKNAENTLRDQAIPVQRIGLHDLKASPIQWADYVTSDGEIVRTPPKMARPHQQQAIDSALIHLESPGTRGKLLMPAAQARPSWGSGLPKPSPAGAGVCSSWCRALHCSRRRSAPGWTTRNSRPRLRCLGGFPVPPFIMRNRRVRAPQGGIHDRLFGGRTGAQLPPVDAWTRPGRSGPPPASRE